MSVEGLCQICEAERARYGCNRCGAVVCEDHYDRETGLCTNCAAAAGKRPKSEDEEDESDVLR